MLLLGYRSYLLVVGGAIAALSLACLGLAFWLEPLTGDLTRLGGYAENDYGWNGEQLRFTPPIAAAGDLGQSYDIVVVGDSFSIDARTTGKPRPGDLTHWTDLLAARTGLSVASFHRDRVSLERYLASEGFVRTPPKVLVVEYAERTLQWAPVSKGARCAATGQSRSAELQISPTRLQPSPYERDRSHRIDNASIDNALDFTKKNVPRLLAGLNTTRISRHRLSRADLFTSRDSGHLLVFADDFAKLNLSEEFLQSLSCYFAQAQGRVEANGVTKFVLMIAPDRTTAYSPYLPDLDMPNLALRLARTPGLSMARVDQRLQEAIALGVQDVYYPSDTHWAYAGMSIAADALIAFLSADPVQ